MESVTSRFIDFLYNRVYVPDRTIKKIVVPIDLYHKLNEDYRNNIYSPKNFNPPDINNIYFPPYGFVKLEVKR